MHKVKPPGRGFLRCTLEPIEGIEGGRKQGKLEVVVIKSSHWTFRDGCILLFRK